jgi:hypothetical protein
LAIYHYNKDFAAVWFLDNSNDGFIPLHKIIISEIHLFKKTKVPGIKLSVNRSNVKTNTMKTMSITMMIVIIMIIATGAQAQETLKADSVTHHHHGRHGNDKHHHHFRLLPWRRHHHNHDKKDHGHNHGHKHNKSTSSDTEKN